MLISQEADTSRARSGYSGMLRWLPVFVLLLLLSVKTSVLQPVEAVMYQWLYQPLRDVTHWPLRLFSETWSEWQTSGDIEAQVKVLSDENHLLRAQLQTLGHLQAENKRLRMLMEAVPNVRVPVSVAELRETAIDGFRELITVARGSDDGAYVSQAVIDPYGLVGQVIEVWPNEAKVMLISDARSRVPVYIARTQQRSVVIGGAAEGQLLLPDMRMESDIVEGDVLVSSGLGGIYPRGYPVAEVVRVERDTRRTFLNVTLRPVAHLSSMLEVLLLDKPAQDDNAADTTLAVGALPSEPVNNTKDAAND